MSQELQYFGDKLWGGIKESANQFHILFVKHLFVSLRQWPSSLARLIFPVVVILALFYLVQQGKSGEKTDQNPMAEKLGGIPRTGGKGGITLLYTPHNDATVYQLMQHVAKSNDPPLSIGPLGDLSTDYDVVAVPNVITAWDLFTKNDSLILSAAVSFGEKGNDTNGINYVLWGYGEFADPFAVRHYNNLEIRPQVQRAVDEAIIQLVMGQAKLTVNLKDLPDLKPATGSIGTFIFTIAGGAFFWIAIFAHVLMVLSKVNYDRNNQLRIGLKMMGLQVAPYWVSLFLTESLFGILTSASIVTVGYACNLDFFRHTNIIVNLVQIWIAVLCFISFAILITCLVHGTVGSNVLVVLSFLIGILLMTFSALGQFWSSSINQVLSPIFMPVNWGKVIHDISSLSLSVATDSGYTVKPPGFHWNDLFHSYPAEPGVPTTFVILLYMLMNAAVMFLLAMYVDTVWPGEFGVPQSAFFFITPKYWGFGGPSESMVEVQTYDSSRLNSILVDMDPDVNREFQNTMAKQGNRDENAAVRILKISKTYKKGICNCASAQDQRALDFLTLSGEKGTVLCILGHNGAGKTTAINCLTGVQAPSFGDAFIFEKSIISEMNEVRKISGVCPQNNILWPELTAKEHLQMFAKLKGVPRNEVDAVVLRQLEQVGLVDVADQRATTFSGGMKRRLSVGIASIGNPKIIFLDEPTSGLDPKNRRQIWNLVQEMKKNAIVILTTHSMEEADTLGDKIAIMAMGRLRAVGTSLHLKNRFGVGYHINLIVENERVEEAKQRTQKLLPDIVLDTETAGNLSYSLPRAKIDDVSQFFRFVESELQSSEGEKLIKDWGISQTTMEEVFLRITHGDNHRGAGGAIGFYTGGTANEKQQLNISVEGKANPIGFVMIDEGISALELRELIRANLPKTPLNYTMLHNGIPVSGKQEQTTMAVEFLPLLYIQMDEGEEQGGAVVDRGKQEERSSAVLEEEVKRLKEELSKLKKDLAAFLSTKEELKKQQHRVQELEDQLTAARAEIESLRQQLPLH